MTIMSLSKQQSAPVEPTAWQAARYLREHHALLMLYVLLVLIPLLLAVFL